MGGKPLAGGLALALSGALSAVLAGCTTAGPNYAPPSTGVSASPAANGAFVSARGAAFAQAELPDRWWKLYNDPRLDALVGQALVANADLRAADANLRRADAIVRETAAGREISTGISGGVTESRPSGTGQGLPGTLSYNLGLEVSYPLDLRGKIRRAIEASEADRDAVAAARDAVRASVAAATTKAYADVCAANYQYGVIQQVVRLQGETLNATRRLGRVRQGGVISAVAVGHRQAALAVMCRG